MTSDPQGYLLQIYNSYQDGGGKSPKQILVSPELWNAYDESCITCTRIVMGIDPYAEDPYAYKEPEGQRYLAFRETRIIKDSSKAGIEVSF